MLDLTFASEEDIFPLPRLQGLGMTIGFPLCQAAFVTWITTAEGQMSPSEEAMAAARRLMDMGLIHQAQAALTLPSAADTCAELLVQVDRVLLPICRSGGATSTDLEAGSHPLLDRAAEALTFLLDEGIKHKAVAFAAAFL